MIRDEFEKLIKSIGFKYDGYSYLYKEYIIDLYDDHYKFYIFTEFTGRYEYNDLSPFDEYFKKELRRIKLKQIL